MTFLNPLLLLGLAAAAIPIIIHLLNLRKLKTIEFSTLRFLKELQKTRMRRVKIKQWLLLAIRTLLIIFLVTAFARPALRGSIAGVIGTHARTTQVILLDDSPSMQIRNDQGVLFSQARETTERLLGLLKEGDEAYLLRLSEIRHAEKFTPLRAGDDFHSLLEQFHTSEETVPYAEGFAAAAKLLEDSHNFNQEVHLISDGQATQFTVAGDSADLYADRVKVFVTQILPRLQQNIGLSDLSVESRIISPGKPVTLKITSKNTGPSAVSNSVLSVYLDGTRVVQQSLDIASGATSVISTNVIPKRRGVITGYALLEDDSFEPDNKRSFVVSVPENINVLFVGPTAQDVRYPMLALTLNSDPATTGMYSATSIDESQLSATDIAGYDILVMCGVRDFTTTETERITQFVNAGGGLMIFPGDLMDASNYNSTLVGSLKIPPINPAPPDRPAGEQESFLTFDKIDFAHPIFAGLFEQQAGGRQLPPAVESARIRKHIGLRPGTNGHAIISTSDGAGFLVEHAHGTGKVLLFGVDAMLGWSDFPLKGVFVPLIHRSVLYLASHTGSGEPSIVGNEIKTKVRLGRNTASDAYVFRSPSGIEERTVPHVLSMSGQTVFSVRAMETGVYTLHRAEKDGKVRPDPHIHAIPVNLAPEESDFRAVMTEELAAFWANMGINPDQVKMVTKGEAIDSVVLESRFGVELWKYFVGLALLLALLEMLIGREPRGKERSIGRE